MAPQRKSIVVTGGASGIGLGITRSFAEQGAHISVLDVNSEGDNIVKALSSEFSDASFSFTKVDISNWDELAAAFEQIYRDQGRIDVVMANAGISKEVKLNLDEETPSKPSLPSLDVNLVGTIYTVKLAIHYIKKNTTVNGASPASKGSIICTASNAGLYPFPVAPIYAAGKAGVINLVRSLARPLGLDAIQINALAPAVLETNIAPSKDLFKPMIVTPMSTLTRGVQQLVSNPSLTGQVAEIHGSEVTLAESPAYVDEDTGKNIETFWSLGYA
ncbi:15-hydroxyprostaglandin dehydrogenase [Exophiala viscosa]|uniref:15-hydroxyprostaglandin dehydrogenase n=1 Tax=Exophiala viscosa TaxID=2486360 RepID=A0AAN6E1Z7_9EURO|nr:15-hydroxyprostaglandin dehydrogenase [Exophiala viscosa]